MEPLSKPIPAAGQAHGVRVERLAGLLLQDRFIALALILFVLLTRIPLQSQYLYHWDSVNFAAAIERFDMANESPHPPGYILYVWLTQAVNRIFLDPQVTMVTISIAASALAAVALYFLGKAMYNQAVGVIASILLASSPIFWFYGEIALPHTLDALLIIMTVWLLYLTMRGDMRYLYPAVVLAGLAGGLRPQTLVFLLPLILFALRKAGLKRIIGAGVVGMLVCLAWFIPLVNATGGVSSYFSIMGQFSDRFQESTSIFMGAGLSGVQRNATKVVLYTLYGLSLALLPLAAYLLTALKRLRRILEERNLFLLFWMAPVLFFYLAIHMGQQGLIFVYLPALLLLSAYGMVRLFGHRPTLLALGTASLLVFNIGVFTLLPEYPLGPGTQRMLTADTLRNSDTYFQSRIEAIEYNFDAGTTGVIAQDWRHAEYYLPEYTIIPLDPVRWDEFTRLEGSVYLTPENLGLAAGANSYNLVLFDKGLDQRDESMPGTVQYLPMQNGELLPYYQLSMQEQFRIELDPIRWVQE